MDYDDKSYEKFTGPGQADKAIHTLEGILNGIAIDGEISKTECKELKLWCSEHERYISSEPFKSLIPYIIEAIDDDYLDENEKEDILFMCKTLQSSGRYYDSITSDLQRLQGIFHGVFADDEISDDEVKALKQWTEENTHLIGKYPYDELYTLLLNVLEDGKIDDSERRLLSDFFKLFISRGNDQSGGFAGINTSNPEITFDGKTFCITGKFDQCPRSEVVAQIAELGGEAKPNVSQKVDYIVIGGMGNEAWAFNRYGRKIEQATTLRKEGFPLQIISEADFWDAVEDFRE